MVNADTVKVPASPPLTWHFVDWRGRVLSHGSDVAERLARAVVALDRLDQIGGTPVVRWSGGDQVRFEMWFAADSVPGVMRGARLALKQAFASAGIGDPNPPPGITHAHVRLVLEEWPTVDRLP